MTRTANENVKEREEGRVINFPLTPVLEYADDGHLVFARTLLSDNSVIEHHMEYDDRGNLKRYFNTDGFGALYKHNEYGAVSEFRAEDGIVRLFEFDETGNIIKETNENGKPRQFKFSTDTDNYVNEHVKIDFDGSESKKIVTKYGQYEESADRKLFTITAAADGPIVIDLHKTGSLEDFNYSVDTGYLENGAIAARTKFDREDRIINQTMYEYTQINGESYRRKELFDPMKKIENMDMYDKIYDYDRNGNKVHEIINNEDFWYILDEKGNVLMVFSEFGYYRINAYDQFDRQIYYQDSLGLAKWYTYLNPDADDTKILIYRENNYNQRTLIHHFYDGEGLEKRCQTIKDDRSVTDLKFEHYPDGQIKSVTDITNGDWINFEYDDAGNCIRIFTSDGNDEKYQYENDKIIRHTINEDFYEENVWENGNLMKRKVSCVGIADFVQEFAYVGDSEVECHTYSI